MAYLGTSESLILLLGDGGDKPTSDILLASLSDISALGRRLSTLELCIDYFFEFPRQSCVGFQEPCGICSNKVQEVWVNWPDLLPCRPAFKPVQSVYTASLGQGKRYSVCGHLAPFPASGEVCFGEIAEEGVPHFPGSPPLDIKSGPCTVERIWFGGHFMSHFYHFLAV